MLRPLSVEEPENLRLSGHVSYTSRSSMEIIIRMESVSESRGLRDNPETLLVRLD
jgi:acyl-coenzyme A thioesterase 9